MKFILLSLLLLNIINLISSDQFELSKIEIMTINNYSSQFLFSINNNNSPDNNNNNNNIPKFLVSIPNKYCKINEIPNNKIKCVYDNINNFNNNEILIFKVYKNKLTLQSQTIIKQLNIDCNINVEDDCDCYKIQYTEINYDISQNTNSDKMESFSSNEDESSMIIIVIVVSIVGLIIIGGLGTFIFLKYFIKRFQQNISKDIEINNKNLKSISASISED
ncbi:hypothetical protein ACTA71_000785 [Dictyostelium dimigraforme]